MNDIRPMIRIMANTRARKTALDLFDQEEIMEQWDAVYDELKGAARLGNTAEYVFLIIVFSILRLIRKIIAILRMRIDKS